jgi:hypothetical protein
MNDEVDYDEYDVGELVLFCESEEIKVVAMRRIYSQYAGKLATVIEKTDWYAGSGRYHYRVLVDGILAPEFIWRGALKKLPQ